ncbi:MAG: hypothetical protein ACJAUY_000533 [Cognaticolwellia sp.]
MANKAYDTELVYYEFTQKVLKKYKPVSYVEDYNIEATLV